MLIHAADPGLAAKWDDEAQAAFSSWLEESISAGVNLQGSRLRPSADATTVKIRDGRLIITDGPFAETKEQIAGYDVLECASLDEAVHWAGRHPSSWVGAIEVRALPDSAPAVPLPGPGEGKIRYVMLVCTDPAVDPEEFTRIEPVDPWVAEMDGRGIRRYGSELEPPGSARTVRVRDSRAIVTDGPFAETKEQIAGFDVLECADLDEAIEVASRHPMARLGILEVRPFWPFED
ncbi:MAG TPA: YciI family protein [Trebonia sp.]|nr:YciI family protein [Trebonia sp.]